MNLRVDVGGNSRWWRLLESERLSAWLQGRPWNGQGVVLAFELADAYEDEILDGLEGDVRRVERDEEVVVRVLRASALDATSALRDEMGIETGSRRDLAERLAASASRDPNLWILIPPSGAPVASWVDELQQVVDVHAKLPCPGRVAFLVTARSEHAIADRVRMDLAWPEHTYSVEKIRDRWTAYVHERLAWHAGGSLSIVASFASRVRSIPTGQDIALEDALDAHALELLDTHDASLVKRLSRDVSSVRYDPQLMMPLGMTGHDARVARPVPWLARGLLFRYREHPQRRFLRSVRICRPLASRLFDRCMDAEQRIRDRLLARAPQVQLSEQVGAHVARVERDKDAIEHQLTPRGQAELEGGWEAATLADLIDASDLTPSQRTDMHKLRLTRNALAHGSPVGWKAILIVDDLEGRLS